MINKDAFITKFKTQHEISESDIWKIETLWDDAYNVAMMANEMMPGIGFLSVRKRLNAFFSVCLFIDQIVNQGAANAEHAQLSLQILRLSNNSFEKSISMFEIRKSRFDVRARSEMPATARTYLTMIQK